MSRAVRDYQALSADKSEIACNLLSGNLASVTRWQYCQGNGIVVHQSVVEHQSSFRRTDLVSISEMFFYSLSCWITICFLPMSLMFPA